jgi:hypothetical protein
MNNDHSAFRLDWSQFTNLESFPGMIFVTLGSLDNPERIEPVLEMFTKRRLEWAKPLDLPQFENMPS